MGCEPSLIVNTVQEIIKNNTLVSNEQRKLLKALAFELDTPEFNAWLGYQLGLQYSTSDLTSPSCSFLRAVAAPLTQGCGENYTSVEKVLA